MSMLDIFWNDVWKSSIRKNAKPKCERMSFWNKRAPDFMKAAEKSDYIDQFLEIMDPQPDWTVLDMGCAAGTLAIPLARKVRSVTAVDPSSGMRDLLRLRCEQEGIDNIRIVDGSWEQDWEALEIAPHDVFMASRSLVVPDLQASVEKVQRFAREKVFLSTLVGDGPYDPQIFEAVGRDFNPGTDYILAVNVLRQMGIYADVAFTYNNERKVYPDHDAAFSDLLWMIHDMNEEEKKRLRKHLKETLVPFENGVRMPYARPVRWAVLSWDKQTGGGAEPVEA